MRDDDFRNAYAEHSRWLATTLNSCLVSESERVVAFRNMPWSATTPPGRRVRRFAGLGLT